MQSSDASRPYVLGHSDNELIRLEQQAAFFAGATEDVLRSAGLDRGMRVLDLGCGVGDVSMIAGRLVGATGSVLGIDKSEDAVKTARRRSEAAGLSWVTFAEQNFEDFPESAAFDAVIGRFILVHLHDPAAVLRRAVNLLRPNGILAFAEFDIRSAAITPPAPLFQRCLGWILTVYENSGLEPNMGSELYGVFRKAGLDPTLSAYSRLTGGSDPSGPTFMAETIRSMQPALEAYGIADSDAIGSVDLPERLAREAAQGDHCIAFPRFVGAWARRGS